MSGKVVTGGQWPMWQCGTAEVVCDAVVMEKRGSVNLQRSKIIS